MFLCASHLSSTVVVKAPEEDKADMMRQALVEMGAGQRREKRLSSLGRRVGAIISRAVVSIRIRF